MTPLRLFQRDVMLSWRRGGGAYASIGFYIGAMAVFAFGLGAEVFKAQAASMAAVAALFACLLSLNTLFERDYEDGTLEQWLIMPAPLEWYFLAKIAVHWLSICLPLILIAPLLAYLSGAGGEAACMLALALLAGTPALSAIGTLGAILTTGERQAALAQILIILPLYLPPLIFIASGTMSGVALLMAMSLAAVPLAAIAGAFLIRVVFE